MKIHTPFFFVWSYSSLINCVCNYLPTPFPSILPPSHHHFPSLFRLVSLCEILRLFWGPHLILSHLVTPSVRFLYVKPVFPKCCGPSSKGVCKAVSRVVWNKPLRTELRKSGKVFRGWSKRGSVQLYASLRVRVPKWDSLHQCNCHSQGGKTSLLRIFKSL